MVPLLLFSAALGAAPVQVTLARSVGMESAESEAFVVKLSAALLDAQVGATEVLPPEVDQACAGELDCRRDAARAREGRVLLDVELAWVAGQLGASLTATDVKDGSSLAAHRFIVAGGERYHLALDAELVRFARLVRQSLPEEPTPMQTEGAFAIVPSSLEARRMRTVQRVAIGGAVASGVAASVFAALGVQAGQTLDSSYVRDDSGQRFSTLDQQRATALADTTNARMTGALITTGIALGLAGVAVWLELEDSE